MKIVINKCYGGFGLSEKAMNALGFAHMWEARQFFEEHRNDERLVALVQYDAKGMSGICADLDVVEIPDDATDWRVDEYDGMESVTYVRNGRLYRAF